MSKATPFYKAEHPIRFVTAASLFDGHDASINIIRRLLQAAGCEVIHLGHNRSVEDVVIAAIQEDVQGIAISSYQGGHVEYLKYMKDLLRERGAGHVKIFCGGGGTIVPREVEELQAYGIDRIFSAEDGRHLGLEGMINLMLEAADFDPLQVEVPAAGSGPASGLRLARRITLAERNGRLDEAAAEELARALAPAEPKTAAVPVVGLTGPGGAGKSSFTDELVRRFRMDFPDLRIGILSVDPSKRLTGGALLGDRIRMNSIYTDRVYMRSLATRGVGTSLSTALGDAITALKAEGFDLVLVETPGIGQGDSAVVDLVDLSLYVMTPEYGAPSQLEKIDMLDLATIVVLNKFDRRGAEDALRDVRKQYRRSRELFHGPPDEELPIFGCVSSHFDDEGVSAAFRRLLAEINSRFDLGWESRFAARPGADLGHSRGWLVPPARQNYLSEIAEAARSYRAWAENQVVLARRWDALDQVIETVATKSPEVCEVLEQERERVRAEVDPRAVACLESWPALTEAYSGDELVFQIRGRELRAPLRIETLSGTRLARVTLPRARDRATALRYLLLENVPGSFPFTAGVFPLKRADEDPKRMFAGEGGPGRTNRRFHFLCRGEKAHRLSTAFDSVTLYGDDPNERPDIYGKIGESGVSICTLEDMRKLFAGFDLCSSNTSVSMTINGPAPMILAMFMNAAIDQQVDLFRKEHDRLPDPEQHAEIVARTLHVVRGTVQADILKEDQAQNTCIFSTEFALRMMGDIQEFFIENAVRNYYSVSISGYHIAEAGANPITQLALTLSNAFTYVEYYLARGMKVDDFAPNLSFFFSNGLDAEYTVLGRVARRIWSVAMRDVYHANARSQKLKYHIQTSGRSLHAQEIDFNDIRTTLQAVLALQDHCNSLHTNSYDEAITTPTPESVRRAMAIQLIITKEYGISKSENLLQGSHVIDELTDLVEEAVLTEFERISDRGGVLGAMETQYQRGRIQEESLLYERLKHSGELPIVGVNTYVDEDADHQGTMDSLELTRSTHEDKTRRIADLRAFQEACAPETAPALDRLKACALSGGNIFAELMSTVRSASLGQITDALFEVGGAYRRNM